MRICLATHEFLPRTGLGGVAALYTDLAKALVRQGNEVTVIAGNSRHGVDTDICAGVRRVRVGRRWVHPILLSRCARAYAVMRHYRKLVQSGNVFDVLETPEIRAEGFLVNTVCKPQITAVRLVTPSFLLAQINGMRYGRVADWMEKKNASLSDVIMADSRLWAEHILRQWELPTSKLRMCRIGIDLNRIDNADTIDPLVSGDYVLFSGRLTLAKGPQILAKASHLILKDNPHCKIVFAGADTRLRGGDTMRRYIAECIPSEYRHQAVFLGFVESWDHLVALYKNAAVCVKADSYGNHSLDAIGQMACARPLVATKTEGNSDLVNDGVDGYLFDRGNSAELARHVNLLLSSPDLRSTVGRRAREKIETYFTSEICARETARIFQELVG